MDRRTRALLDGPPDVLTLSPFLVDRPSVLRPPEGRDKDVVTESSHTERPGDGVGSKCLGGQVT